jgi:hypothetical protein
MMTSATSRLVLAVLAATLLYVPACVQPGEVDDPPTPGTQPDADLSAPDAEVPPQQGTPDAAVVNPPPPSDPSFATDIYPKLQSTGLTCAGCHQAGGQASFLPFNDGAATVYGRLQQNGRVNTGSPDQSLILLAPLTGSSFGQHPFKPFADTNNQDYKTILNWIQKGAKQ